MWIRLRSAIASFGIRGKLLLATQVHSLADTRTLHWRVKRSRFGAFKPITSRLPNSTSNTRTRPTPIGCTSRKSSAKEKERDSDDQNTHAPPGTVLRRPLHGLRGDCRQGLRRSPDVVPRRARCGNSCALCRTPFSPSVKEECVHSTRQCGRFGITPAMRTQPLGTTPSDLIKA